MALTIEDKIAYKASLYGGMDALYKQIQQWAYPELYKKAFETRCLDVSIQKELFESIAGTEKNSDLRDKSRYIMDVFVGWLHEDYIIDGLKTLYKDYKFVLHGSDRKRKLLIKEEVGSDPDIEVKKSDELLCYIEIMGDYGSFWKKTGTIDFRHNKYRNSLSKNFDTVFLLHCFQTNKIKFFHNRKDSDKIVDIDMDFYNRFWNKKCNRIWIKDFDLLNNDLSGYFKS